MGLLMYKDIPYSGGGTDVEANPSGTATEDLTKLGIDETIYDVVDNDAVHSDDVGVANGVAELDSNGKVPSSQLPTYPTVNNGTLTIQKNGTTIATFTANQSGNSNANISVPTTPSDIDAASESDVASTQTATGNPLTLSGVAPINAEKLEVVMEPKQDLHGQSYPYVGGAGYNKWDEEWEVGMLVDDGVVNINATNRRTTSFIPVEQNTEYYSSSGYVLSGRVAYYDGNKNCIYFSASGLQTQRFTTPNNAYFMRITLVSSYGTTYNHDISINYPSSITTYSPYSNICPISGYDSVSVDDVGKNRFSGWTMGKTLNDRTGEEITSSTGAVSDYLEVSVSNGDYLSGITNQLYSFTAFFDANKNYIGRTSGGARTGYTINTSTISGASDAKYIRVTQYENSGVSGTIDLVNSLQTQLESGTSATTYEPYQSTTASITFGQTVYGGKSDFVKGGTSSTNAYGSLPSSGWAVNGQSDTYLYLTHSLSGSVVVANTDTSIRIISDMFRAMSAREILATPQSFGVAIISSNRIYVCVPKSMFTSSSEFEAWVTNTAPNICYELAEPIFINTPPTPLRLLKGTNNLSTDGTSMTIGYQPDNVIGELKEDLQQHTEMQWLQVKYYGEQIDFKGIEVPYGLSSSYEIADNEFLKHRFILVEFYYTSGSTSSGQMLATVASALLSVDTLLEADAGAYIALAIYTDGCLQFNIYLNNGKYYVEIMTFEGGGPVISGYFIRARLVD